MKNTINRTCTFTIEQYRTISEKAQTENRTFSNALQCIIESYIKGGVANGEIQTERNAKI